MMKWHVEKHNRPSSPERRAAAKATVEQMRARREEITRELKALGETVGPLAAMAKFVCDVDGDPTAVARLREALGRHQTREALVREKAACHKAEREARGGVQYYRWTVGELDRVGGIGMLFVLGQGDTKAEAMAKAKSKK